MQIVQRAHWCGGALYACTGVAAVGEVMTEELSALLMSTVPTNRPLLLSSKTSKNNFYLCEISDAHVAGYEDQLSWFDAV
jgi:hypothetical protein